MSQTTMRHGLSVGGDTLVIDSIIVSGYSLLFYSADNEYGLNNDVVGDFLNLAGITDSQDSMAIDYLYNALIDSGLWNKYYVIYPVAGSTDQSHSINLKIPGQYTLDYEDNISHDSSGMWGDGGLHSYADTKFVPLAGMAGDLHLSFFSVSDTFDGYININIGTSDPDNSKKAMLSSSSRVVYEKANYAHMGGDAVFYPSTESKGYFIATATDSSTSIFRDGVKTMYSTVDGDTVTGFSIYLFAGRNDIGVAIRSSESKCIFSTIGKGFTDDEAYTASQIVRTYNGMINRWVDSTYIGREKSTYPLSLIELGYDAEPTQVYDTDLANWDSLNYGAMISWNARSYILAGDMSFGGYPASPYIIDQDSIDVGAWVSPLDSAGVEFIYFTLFGAHGQGIEPIPDSIAFPKRLVDKFNGYTKYDSEVNPNMDNNIFEQFVDTCRGAGIIPIPYINPMRNLNLQPGTGWAHKSWDSTDCVHYNNWLAKYCQYIIGKYDFKYIWVDGWQGQQLDTEEKSMVTDFQLLYNSIKAIDTSCMVIMNHWADSGFIRYPYDIGSSEEWVIDNRSTFSDAVIADTLRYNGGKQYIIPAEFIVNVAGTPYETIWYAMSDTGIIIRPIAEVQAIYDRAAAVGAKFALSVIPGRNGIVQKEQWAIWRNMVW